jgi:hypothetical protein
MLGLIAMCGNHVEFTESLFYPSNTGVHPLEAAFTGAGARSCAGGTTMLEAAGF